MPRLLANRFRRVASAILLTAAWAMATETAEAQALVLSQRVELSSIKGRLDHMAIDLNEGRLCVAALGVDSVEVIDLKAGKRIAGTRGLHEPQGLFVSRLSTLFVAVPAVDGSHTVSALSALADGFAASSRSSATCRGAAETASCGSLLRAPGMAVV